MQNWVPHTGNNVIRTLKVKTWQLAVPISGREVKVYEVIKQTKCRTGKKGINLV